MSEDHDNDNDIAEQLVPRLAGFATGLGLDGPTMRQIIEKVVADMPHVSDEDRLAKARLRMIVASA
ncbi:hypothetical protein [Methylobacterium brachiatum]|jgi:hypothetical protein|uniref:DUF2267 domain-containing protein n=1 Tax=Methylobacterium brachiatum TaxID=269660 RepID=A0ABV1RBG8_9HYPH